MGTDSASIDKSTVLRQWYWPLRTAFWIALIGSCVALFGVLAQAAWALHKAPDDPLAYQQQVLLNETRILAELPRRWVDPPAIAQSIYGAMRATVEAIVVVTLRTFMNVPGMTRQFEASHFVREHEDAGGAYAEHVMQTAGWKLHLALMSGFGFAIRTAMYAAIAPVLLVCALLGVSDGVVGRMKRKADAGRESASLYHRGKLGATFVLITGYLLLLGLPNAPSNPLWLVAIAVCIGLLLRLQVTYYKKYL